MENRPRFTFKQCILLSFASIAMFVALWNYKEVLSVISSVFSYLMPLFIGACLAFVLNVPTKAFERMFAFIQRKCNLKVRHTLNTYLGFVLTLVAVGSAITVFVNKMVPQLAVSGTDIVNRFRDWYPTALNFLHEHNIDINVPQELDIDKLYDFVKSYFSFDNAITVVNTVIDAASSTFSVAISAISCVAFSIYLITGKKKLNHQLHKLLYAYTPKRFADKACYIGTLSYKTFYNFISSQCLDALVLSLLLYAALRIFKLPYAGISCVLTGVLALIPYVGAFLSCFIGAMLLLLVSPFKALMFVVIFLVVQQIEGQFIYPHLVGNSIGLPAIWTLFAALAGGQMMGLFGLIFFIPFTAVVYTLIKESTARRLKEKGIVVESPAESEEREKKEKLMEKRRLRVENRHRKKEEKRKKREDKKGPRE